MSILLKGSKGSGGGLGGGTLFTSSRSALRCAQPTLFRDHAQIVKVSHGIGFRPQAHFAGISKRFVRRLNFLRSVEITNNFIPDAFHPEFVPFVRIDAKVCTA